MNLLEDPEILALEDELEAAEAGILDIDPEDLREAQADALLRQRSHGLSEDDLDPDDLW